MKVKWLRKALSDLDQELAYITEQNPRAAQLVATRIASIVYKLPQNPELGFAGRVRGTRELVIPKTRYLIPYRVRPRLNQIEILRVFHTSWRPPRTW